MKHTEVEQFVKNEELLASVRAKSGIYAITIDDFVVYVGQSKNMYQRCCSHIYNMENAMLNNEKKYLLLLSAKLGGHKVDCVPLAYCKEAHLTALENDYIEVCSPCLNILTPYGKQNINRLKIEDVLKQKQAYIETDIKKLILFQEDKKPFLLSLPL